jgi:hypothetical protein
MAEQDDGVASIWTKPGDGVTKGVDMLNVCFGPNTCDHGKVHRQSKKWES